MKNIAIASIIASLLTLSACGSRTQEDASSLASASTFVSTSNPDSYAKRDMDKTFKSMSDTGRSEVTECYRKIDRADLIQIVCKGKIEVLVFGGHRTWAGAACRYNFTPKQNGQFLTTSKPECTE